VPALEGWPSGLRRRPAKALGRNTRVGSNPTPSVKKRPRQVAWTKGVVGDTRSDPRALSARRARSVGSSRAGRGGDRAERARAEVPRRGERTDPIPPPPRRDDHARSRGQKRWWELHVRTHARSPQESAERGVEPSGPGE